MLTDHAMVESTARATCCTRDPLHRVQHRHSAAERPKHAEPRPPHRAHVSTLPAPAPRGHGDMAMATLARDLSTGARGHPDARPSTPRDHRRPRRTAAPRQTARPIRAHLRDPRSRSVHRRSRAHSIASRSPTPRPLHRAQSLPRELGPLSTRMAVVDAPRCDRCLHRSLDHRDTPRCGARRASPRIRSTSSRIRQRRSSCERRGHTDAARRTDGRNPDHPAAAARRRRRRGNANPRRNNHPQGPATSTARRARARSRLASDVAPRTRRRLLTSRNPAPPTMLRYTRTRGPSTLRRGSTPAPPTAPRPKTRRSGGVSGFMTSERRVPRRSPQLAAPPRPRAIRYDRYPNGAPSSITPHPTQRNGVLMSSGSSAPSVSAARLGSSGS